MASSEEAPRVDHVASGEGAKCGGCGRRTYILISVDLRPLDLTAVASAISLSCDSPTEDAAIQEGEAILNLGSRAGFDVFLAADLVGATGRVVGLDVSKDTVDLSRQRAIAKGLKPPQLAFALASFTEGLPIESCSVDCVLSNCAVNISQKDVKALVLRETYRVLRPGGRVHFSDITAMRDTSADLKTVYANCVSSEEYEDLLRNSGFINISLSPTILKCQERGGQASFDLNQFITSRISARKPESTKEKISPTILKQWWDAYPSVQSSPEAMMKEEVAALIRDPSKEDFVVVDVRRNDHAGGHVRGSVQCPAQSFYDDAPEYFEKFKNTEKVIFYCQSSNGRGPRCAGWYQDFLDSVGCSSSKAYVLAGGIKGWKEKYNGQHDLMDYD